MPTGPVSTLTNKSTPGATDRIYLSTSDATPLDRYVTVAQLLATITGLTVAQGGTGNSTFTAYSVITAGTTATGAFQNVSGVGSSGQVLMSNGAGLLPTWQTYSGWVLNGNTVTSEKWLGTIDNFALPFRTNNVERLTINTSGNVRIGDISVYSLDAQRWLAIGGTTLTGSILLAKQNAGVGSSLGAICFGNQNTTTNATALAMVRGIGSSADLTSGKLEFHTKSTAGSNEVRVTIDHFGNMGIATSVFGTDAAGVLALFNSVVPSTSPADTVQIFSTDISAGNASLGLRTERTVEAIGVVVATNFLQITVNGTIYKMLLST